MRINYNLPVYAKRVSVKNNKNNNRNKSDKTLKNNISLELTAKREETYGTVNIEKADIYSKISLFNFIQKALKEVEGILELIKENIKIAAQDKESDKDELQKEIDYSITEIDRVYEIAEYYTGKILKKQLSFQSKDKVKYNNFNEKIQVQKKEMSGLKEFSKVIEKSIYASHASMFKQ